MGKILNTLRSVANNFGMDVIKLEGRRLNVSALSNNFENLAANYEKLFSAQFGEIPENETRRELMKDLLGTPPSQAYFIINALHKSAAVEGDVCEFGVAQGVTSQLIANEIKSGTKKLHLFDSFEGLPAPTEKDELKDDIFGLGSMEAYTGTMSNPESLVKARLAQIQFPQSRYQIHKGFIEKSSGKDNPNFPKLVSFAYVDFDFYEPLLIALNLLRDITKSGAVLVVDDYDFFSTGAKTAVDEFVAQYPEEFELFVPDTLFGHFAVLTKR